MTVPIVVSTDPSNLAVDVAITKVIAVTFNTVLDPATVDIGTAYLFRTDTGEEIDVDLSVSSNIIYMKPSKALYENKTYRVGLVGSADGSPAGNIKSLDGDDLVDTYTFSFSSQIRQYATLEEVQERADITVDGPISLDDITEAGGLDLVSVSPGGFASDLSTDLDEVIFTFSANIDESTLTGNVTMETENVLGDEELYGAVADSDGEIYLQGWSPGTGECDYTQPTGEFTVSGNQVIWTRGTGEPLFNYNSQIIFTINQDLKDENGHYLLSDVIVSMTSQYFPKFQTAKIMRSYCGPMLANQYDDTINRILHRASMDAWDLAGWMFDIHDPKPEVKRYVRYRAILDLFNLISARARALAGQRKALGDLEIEYPRVTEPRLDYGLDAEARNEIKRLEKALKHYRRQGLPCVAIKGISAGDSRLDPRSRRWDIEYEYGSLFYDMMNAILPASNLRLMRATKLAAADDAHPHSIYVPSVSYYASQGGGGGLFVAPTPSTGS